jgi:hypothetical protein
LETASMANKQQQEVIGEKPCLGVSSSCSFATNPLTKIWRRALQSSAVNAANCLRAAQPCTASAAAASLLACSHHRAMLVEEQL